MKPIVRLFRKKANPYVPGPPEENTELLGESPEPDYLASRIQALIDSLPPVKPHDGKEIIKPPKAIPPTRDENGRAVPPPGTTPIKDEKLIAFLSSASIMNGDPNGSRPSVWSILQKMHPSSSGGPSADKGPDGNDGGTDGSQEDYPTLMLCGPVIPTKDSKVELALSKLVPSAQFGYKRHSVAAASWWPWKRKTTPPAVPDTEKTVERVWVPSTTKLSVQVMWWGFSLWLPPPVLEVLNNKQLEASKRAAMIANALTWIVTNIPIELIPLPLQPAVLILQRIVPVIGYLAGFISWSWETIKSFDKGLGVILTATWILPVALIPGTWEVDSAPTPPPASEEPAPQPAPPTGAGPAPTSPPPTGAEPAPPSPPPTGTEPPPTSPPTTGTEPVPTPPPPTLPSPGQDGPPTTNPVEPVPSSPVPSGGTQQAAQK